MVSRLAAGVKNRIGRDIVAAPKPVVYVDHGARAVEEDVALGARQARLGREPRGGLQLEGAELVHLVVRDDSAPGLLAGRPVVLVAAPEGRYGGHADEGELGQNGGVTLTRAMQKF